MFSCMGCARLIKQTPLFDAISSNAVTFTLILYYRKANKLKPIWHQTNRPQDITAVTMNVHAKLCNQEAHRERRTGQGAHTTLWENLLLKYFLKYSLIDSRKISKI